jgi:hypothetical protein
VEYAAYAEMRNYVSKCEKGVRMKTLENRLTKEDVKKMGMFELAHNQVFAKDGWAWYRDFEREISIIDLIKEIATKHNIEDDLLSANEEDFDEIMTDNLQFGTNTLYGVLAMYYQALWAMGDLRSWLKPYEDTGLSPEEVEQLKKDEDYWHREALKWASKLGEQRLEYAKLLIQFGIPEQFITDDGLEKFMDASRQQD